MSWTISKFFLTCCLLYKPWSWRWFYIKLISSIMMSYYNYSHWDIRSNVSSLRIEILTKMHHINTKWTKRLTHLRIRLGYSGEHQKIYLSLMTCWHLNQLRLYFYKFFNKLNKINIKFNWWFPIIKSLKV